MKISTISGDFSAFTPKDDMILWTVAKKVDKDMPGDLFTYMV